MDVAVAGTPIPWAAGGDERLRYLVPWLQAESNPSHFVLVSSHLTGRTARECRERWLQLKRGESGALFRGEAREASGEGRRRESGGFLRGEPRADGRRGESGVAPRLRMVPAAEVEDRPASKASSSKASSGKGGGKSDGRQGGGGGEGKALEKHVTVERARAATQPDGPSAEPPRPKHRISVGFEIAPPTASRPEGPWVNLCLSCLGPKPERPEPAEATSGDAPMPFKALRERVCLWAGCGERFKDEQRLRKHVRRSHMGVPLARPFSCPVCGRTFTEKHNMRTHLRIHERQAAAAGSRAADDGESRREGVCRERPPLLPAPSRQADMAAANAKANAGKPAKLVWLDTGGGTPAQANAWPSGPGAWSSGAVAAAAIQRDVIQREADRSSNSTGFCFSRTALAATASAAATATATAASATALGGGAATGAAFSFASAQEATSGAASGGTNGGTSGGTSGETAGGVSSGVSGEVSGATVSRAFEIEDIDDVDNAEDEEGLEAGGAPEAPAMLAVNAADVPRDTPMTLAMPIDAMAEADAETLVPLALPIVDSSWWPTLAAGAGGGGALQQSGRFTKAQKEERKLKRALKEVCREHTHTHSHAHAHMHTRIHVWRRRPPPPDRCPLAALSALRSLPALFPLDTSRAARCPLPLAD